MKRIFILSLLAAILIPVYAANTRNFNASNPDVHDPVMAMEDGVYYMFTTGFGVNMMSSTDLKS